LADFIFFLHLSQKNDTDFHVFLKICITTTISPNIARFFALAGSRHFIVHPVFRLVFSNKTKTRHRNISKQIIVSIAIFLAARAGKTGGRQTR
jgi:hypothetical protein